MLCTRELRHLKAPGRLPATDFFESAGELIETGLHSIGNISEGKLKPDFQLAVYKGVCASVLPVRRAACVISYHLAARRFRFGVGTVEQGSRRAQG